MLKTAVKTALITFASILGAILVATGIASLFFPSAMGDFCVFCGFDKSAVLYYKSAYNGVGDYNDLAKLVNSAEIVGNDKVLSEYGLKFAQDEKFKSYCEEKDKKEGGEVKSYDYYSHIVINATYRQNNYAAAAKFAVDMTFEYDRNSPLATAIILAYSEKNKTFAEEVEKSYNASGKEIKDLSGTLGSDLQLLKNI